MRYRYVKFILIYILALFSITIFDKVFFPELQSRLSAQLYATMVALYWLIETKE